MAAATDIWSAEINISLLLGLSKIKKGTYRMKNGRIRDLLVLIGLFATIASISLAGSKTWDFESGSADWKVANGKWTVTGGIYQETSGKDKAMYAIVGDYRMEKLYSRN